MQKTFTEILAEKMAVPINTRDKRTGEVTGQILPLEAMCLKVMENATARGYLNAINFIRLLTERSQQPDADYAAQQQQRVSQAVAELQAELRAAHLPTDTAAVELTPMARQLTTLRQIAETFERFPSIGKAA